MIARSAVDPLMRFDGTCLWERKSLMPCSSMRPLSLAWAPSNAMTEWLFAVGNPLDVVVAGAAAAAVRLAVGWQQESILVTKERVFYLCPFLNLNLNIKMEVFDDEMCNENL